MSGWVRLWEDMPTDPKWRVVSRRSGQPVSAVIAVFTILMVEGGKAGRSGDISGARVEDIAAALDMDDDAVGAILEAMQGRVVDGQFLSGWDRRQPKREDVSTRRVKEYRERNKACVKRDETHCNAPEAEAEAEADAEVEELPPSLPPEVRSPTPPERGSFLSPDWAPSDTAMALAITELGGQAEASRTLEKFRNYWLSKSGKDGRKRDWERTWRNWVMTEMDRGGRHGKRTDSGVDNSPRGPTKSELNRAAMAEVLTGRADSRLSAASPAPRWADGGPEGACGSEIVPFGAMSGAGHIR